MTRAWMSWSSGKDSAMALAELRGDQGIEVCGLLTSLAADRQRVTMHDVRRTLVEAQASALSLPLHVVELPWPCPNEVHDSAMARVLEAARADGVEAIGFGDLFLDDVRAYRERSLEGTGVAPVFPLWGRPTRELAASMLAAGIEAVVTCVDVAQAPAELCGRWFDDEFLSLLPASADPCGERGEFHTFVANGPGFAQRVGVSVGEATVRDGFAVVDVTPT